MLAAATLATLVALHADGAFFRDGAGAAVILRGADVAGNAKVPPFRAITDDHQLDPLPSWGMNVIRLLFTWEAYEPSPGQYDDAYLQYYVGVVDAAAARGLYVVADFHQDAFSRASIGGCGEGFPQWALPSTVTPSPPDNGPACANWSQRMIGDQALAATWDAFYSDANGARSRYLLMIARVAAALASRPSVLGYDLVNEPGGDEATQIEPLYEDAARAIRAVHPSAIIFVSPANLTSAGIATKLPRPTFDNFAYAPHFYDPALILVHSWNGNDEASAFDQMASTANGWGVPLFVGEWGAPPSADQVDGYVGAIGTELDRVLASSAQWAYTPGWTPTAKDGWDAEDFSIVDDTGATRANFRVRPFARRIAGTPTALVVGDNADATKNSLQLSWTNDPAAGVTELFAPTAWFGGAVDIRAGGDLTCMHIGDLVTCTSPTAGAKSVTLSAPSRKCGLTGLEALLLVALLKKRRRRA